jgi:hypothetical protein
MTDHRRRRAPRPAPRPAPKPEHTIQAGLYADHKITPEWLGELLDGRVSLPPGEYTVQATTGSTRGPEVHTSRRADPWPEIREPAAEIGTNLHEYTEQAFQPRRPPTAAEVAAEVHGRLTHRPDTAAPPCEADPDEPVRPAGPVPNHPVVDLLASIAAQLERIREQGLATEAPQTLGEVEAYRAGLNRAIALVAGSALLAGGIGAPRRRTR